MLCNKKRPPRYWRIWQHFYISVTCYNWIDMWYTRLSPGSSQPLYNSQESDKSHDVCSPCSYKIDRFSPKTLWERNTITEDYKPLEITTPDIRCHITLCESGLIWILWCNHTISLNVFDTNISCKSYTQYVWLFIGYITDLTYTW